jgi:hypothetical protein
MSKTSRFERKSEELKHSINIVQIADMDKRTGRHLHQYKEREESMGGMAVKSPEYKGTA